MCRWPCLAFLGLCVRCDPRHFDCAINAAVGVCGAVNGQRHGLLSLDAVLCRGDRAVLCRGFGVAHVTSIVRLDTGGEPCRPADIDSVAGVIVVPVDGANTDRRDGRLSSPG